MIDSTKYFPNISITETRVEHRREEEMEKIIYNSIRVNESLYFCSHF
jgi:hypothetical protein